jgi:hypothetical protein
MSVIGFSQIEGRGFFGGDEFWFYWIVIYREIWLSLGDGVSGGGGDARATADLEIGATGRDAGATKFVVRIWRLALRIWRMALLARD